MNDKRKVMEMEPKKMHVRKHLSSFQIIILGFAGVILAGALLLMLPFASADGIVTPFHDALFTATSAVCVTGLIVRDTASYWSLFGQSVILILIQIGGMGVVTVAVSFVMLSGKKISLMQRSTMQEAIAAPKTGGIVRLTSFVIRAVLTMELIGALLMLPTFCKKFGWGGIWRALFHSVSAFCNAGFDIMGTKKVPFASLTSFSGNWVVNTVIMLLIVIGGIGFLTWDDIRKKRHHIRQYRMQSKVVLVTSAILILLPAVYFFFYEYAGLSGKERVLASLFQSVTTRTAGFNTMDLGTLSGAGKSLFIILMLIGGSPGSTAGGMKTTTAAVLFANAVSVFRRKEDPHFFGRRISEDTVRQAATIGMLYLSLFLGAALVISTLEKLPFGDCLFETASAIGTVGLTLGITTKLGIISQVILIVLMFFGRVGGLTLIYAAVSNTNKNLSKLPVEKITVG